MIYQYAKVCFEGLRVVPVTYATRLQSTDRSVSPRNAPMPGREGGQREDGDRVALLHSYSPQLAVTNDITISNITCITRSQYAIDMFISKEYSCYIYAMLGYLLSFEVECSSCPKYIVSFIFAYFVYNWYKGLWARSRQ